LASLFKITPTRRINYELKITNQKSLMNCPVCHQSEIAELDSKCKVCGSEMASFRLIKEIKNQREVEMTNQTLVQGKMISLERQLINQHQINGRIRLILLFTLIAFGFYWCTRKTPVIGKSPLQSLIDKRQRIAIDKELYELRNKKELDTFYVMKDKEIIEEVALRYYGNRQMSSLIIRDTGFPNEYKMAIGDTVLLRKSLFIQKSAQ
jgi:hypothetical protein